MPQIYIRNFIKKTKKQDNPQSSIRRPQNI